MTRKKWLKITFLKKSVTDSSTNVFIEAYAVLIVEIINSVPRSISCYGPQSKGHFGTPLGKPKSVNTIKPWAAGSTRMSGYFNHLAPIPGTDWELQTKVYIRYWM